MAAPTTWIGLDDCWPTIVWLRLPLLAIELVAAQTTVLTPAELLQGLSDPFTVLSDGRRRQRPRALDATVAWSSDFLEPEQQRVFRALGFFVGGFDLDAVAAVVGLLRGVVIDVAGALVAKSLVVRTSGDSVSRFTLLETLKACTEDRLVKFDEAAATRDLHAEHLHKLVMAGELLLGSLGAYDHDGLDTDIGHGFYRGIGGALLTYSGDYIQALAAMDDKPDNLVRHDHLVTVLLNVIPTVAVFRILLGQPKMALER